MLCLSLLHWTVINRAHFSVRLNILSIDTDLHYGHPIETGLVKISRPICFKRLQRLQSQSGSCNRASYRHPDLRLKPAYGKELTRWAVIVNPAALQINGHSVIRVSKPFRISQDISGSHLTHRTSAASSNIRSGKANFRSRLIREIASVSPRLPDNPACFLNFVQ